MNVFMNHGKLRFRDLSHRKRLSLIGATKDNCQFLYNRTWENCTPGYDGVFTEDAIYRFKPEYSSPPNIPPAKKETMKEQVRNNVAGYKNRPRPTPTGEELVMFQGRVTIVFWPDGTKTVTKAIESDTVDPIRGYLLNFYLKGRGISRSAMNKHLSWIKPERLNEYLRKYLYEESPMSVRECDLWLEYLEEVYNGECQ